MSKLPILMYHNVSEDPKKSNGLTISVTKLEQQFAYLVQKGYQSYHFSQWDQIAAQNQKAVLITFDDVTVNQLVHAVPLLNKYNLKATFFIPFAYVGQTDQWNNSKEPIMNLEELKSLGPNIELGYHSFYHRPYAQLTQQEIDQDFKLSKEFIAQHDLKVFPVLAYPYGNYPKKEPLKTPFFKRIEDHGIQFAVRIGNKLNAKKTKNLYELKRIDVKGQDSMLIFKLKTRFGKLF